MVNLVAIDPGKSGGVTFFDVEQQNILCTFQFRATEKVRFLEYGIMEEFWDLMSDYAPQHAVMEALLDVRMPKNSPRNVNTTGATWGMQYASLVEHCDHIAVVEPRVWKKYLGLSSDKALSIQLAADLYDTRHHVTLKKHHDVAESILLGHWYGVHKLDWEDDHEY